MVTDVDVRAVGFSGDLYAIDVDHGGRIYFVGPLPVSTGWAPRWMHTVTSADGIFDSGFLNEGDTWSHTFDEPGEFEYFCAPHPWMRATVIVVENG